MTERIYYTDSYLTTFSAKAVGFSSDRLRVYLDRTAFYPDSGGQPHDVGELGGIPVIDVVDEDQGIAHVLERPLADEGAIPGRIDWGRRFDHMQQHTGQHLLSAVLIDLCGAVTVSFHMGAVMSTIDLAVPSLSPEQLRSAELRANQVIAENLPVLVSFEAAAEVEGLRKASEREGTLRIVSIQGLDRSACGGTHVRSTGEIGCILLRGTERIRGNLRLEFVCGLRAVQRARLDFESLTAVGKAFSAGIDETPRLASAQLDRLAEAEKARRKLAAELAGYQGRQLWSDAEPLSSGVRLFVRTAGQLDDEIRAEAQAFTSREKAVYLAQADQPPALLVATSEDAPLHAGNRLKSLVGEHGGRGGGSARMAQGSVPDRASAEAILETLRREVS